MMVNEKKYIPDVDGISWKTNDDLISHPKHFTSHPSGVECITITEWMGFNLGNAIKYIWRAGLKSDDFETDLEKAMWYIEREIGRLKSVRDKNKSGCSGTVG